MQGPRPYIEIEKIEEISRQLRSDGYDIRADQAEKESAYDIVAVKNGHSIAVEVKLRDSLPQSAQHIRYLRERARKEGLDEFRLVLVNRPHTAHIEIEGIDSLITAYMMENLPQELDELSTRTQVLGITDIEYDSVLIEKSAIHIAGSGVVEIELEYAGGEARDGLSWVTDFPFRFALTLDRELKIETVEELKVDTSSFYG